MVEGIYVLSALKSFRTARNRDLISARATEAVCSANVDRGGMRREVSVTLGAHSRRIELNQKPVRKLTDFFGTINAVVFCPEDIGVLKNAPSERRLFLDRMIFHAQPAYALEVAAYEKVLKSRNALLRGERIDRKLVEVYDEQLVSNGVQIMRRRANFLREFEPTLKSSFAEIFDPGFEANLHYLCATLASGVSHDDEADDDSGQVSVAQRDIDLSELAEHFRNQLRTSWARDCARGSTNVGPHRDDFLATLNGNPVKTFGSQGQHRAFVLALKIAEIRFLCALHGHSPILLLDDVTSELDATRNQNLFDFLATLEGQVFITTTDPAFIRLSAPMTRWRVDSGTIVRNS